MESLGINLGDRCPPAFLLTLEYAALSQLGAMPRNMSAPDMTRTWVSPGAAGRWVG